MPIAVRVVSEHEFDDLGRRRRRRSMRADRARADRGRRRRRDSAADEPQ